jgi:hypothetical protein
MSKKESQFSRVVSKKLKELNINKCLWFFVKEAGAIRGIPDILGIYNGVPFVMELKRSESEARKKSGRIVLQRYTLRLVRLAGGLAYIVYPENLQEVLQDLKSKCPQKHNRSLPPS